MVCNFIKKKLRHGVFLWILGKLWEQLVLQNISGGCFCNTLTWKVFFFRQNISRIQVGIRTKIGIGFHLRFEFSWPTIMHQQMENNLIILNHSLTYDENFKSQAHFMKIDLYFSQNIWRGQIWTPVKTPNFLSVFAFWWSASIYVLVAKISSLRLMVWKLVFFVDFERIRLIHKREFSVSFLYFYGLQQYTNRS